VVFSPSVSLFSRINRIQGLTVSLFVAIALLRLIRVVTGISSQAVNIVVVLAFLILLPFAILPPIVRRITWRVRYRLLVTYFLAGVLPILLILLFVQMGFDLVLGQMTNYMLHTELDRRADQLYVTAEELAQAAQENEKPSLRAVAVSAVIRKAESLSVVPEGGPIKAFPVWSKAGFKGVVKSAEGNYFLAAHAAANSGNTTVDVFAVRAIDNAMLAELLPGLASVQVIAGTTVHFRIGTGNANPNLKIVLDSEDVTPAPPAQSFWDAAIESASPLNLRMLETGKTEPEAINASFHPNALLTRVFSTLGNTAPILQFLMIAIGVVFLIVEIGAIVACVKLARILTGTVHDLHGGTKKVESGDFSHRIPVRSNDQLSELASSFNGMTARIEQLIGEVKEKEKLESELEIARQVQAQLFPKDVPKLATLELAGVCNPARVVSGDYYDFIPIESHGAAVVIGDISGKGISAALLMAAVQSSLHAQLAMGEGGDHSTATLVTRLNRQLYANTPPEKYCTFYCAMYDEKNNRLTYTNAGHLAPILIRNGRALRFESNGTVVGIFPEYPFEQVNVGLESGDLLAAFTDGITESENAQEEQFGEDRLIDLLNRNSHRPLNEIIQTVMDAVSSWAYDPAARDDITMLLARKL